mmetsp:Transcript_2672/g.4546  ORF Transcript_2672/g.4546 Transcript_2672/m.4546 type:complete len:254 (-) Transcript_2672:10-771(-)
MMMHRHHHVVFLLAISLLAAKLMADAFFVSNNIVPLKHAAGGQGGRSNRRDDVLLRSSNQEPSSDQWIDTTSSSTSIGDITQNLHGGKYQFSETQYLAGGSLMGQQFAESLYSSCDNEESLIEEEDELPKWALKLQQPQAHKGKQLAGTLTFNDSTKSHTISITNDERSWEKYYAYVLPNNNVQQLFRLSSLRGHLAPRGGASNACDASKPYSDSAHITIELISDDYVTIAGDEVLLIVGTEAEIWRYQLNIE